jgi:hypothetical protein
VAERTLHQLEQWRRELAERTRTELATAQREHSASCLAEQGLRAREMACEHALTAARAEYAQANSIAALQTCARLLAVREAELRACRQRTARAASLRAQTADHVRTCQAALAHAERERLAVTRMLERRAHDVSLRTQRRDEDDLEDAFRGRLAH